jgi:Flp pilus assembly protein TadD
MVFFSRRLRQSLASVCLALVWGCGGPSVDKLVDDAYAHLDSGRYAEAEAAFGRALQKAPNHAEAHAGLGSALTELAQCRRAIEPLRSATKLEPTDAVAWTNLGYCHAWLGDDSAAIDAYQRAARLEPGDIALWQSLESIFEDARDHGSLLQIRTRLADMQDKSPASMLALAEAYCLYGEFLHCELLARDLIRRTALNADAQVMLGWALQGQGNLTDAIRALRGAVQLDSRHARAWDRLATVLQQTGAKREAEVARQTANTLNP